MTRATVQGRGSLAVKSGSDPAICALSGLIPLALPGVAGVPPVLKFAFPVAMLMGMVGVAASPTCRSDLHSPKNQKSLSLMSRPAGKVSAVLLKFMGHGFSDEVVGGIERGIASKCIGRAVRVLSRIHADFLDAPSLQPISAGSTSRR